MTRETCCSFFSFGPLELPKKLSSVVDRLGRLQDTFQLVTLLWQAFGVYISICQARPAATADAIVLVAC